MFLGDSMSTGEQPLPHPPGDVTCKFPSSMTTGKGGWGCVFVHLLRTIKPNLQFKNEATNGEDSCSFYTVSTACSYLSLAQQRKLKPQPGSQLARALTYLKQHREQVNPITFELGANDSIVTGVKGQDVAALEARLDRILARLHRAAPHALLMLMDYPTVTSPLKHDPFPSFYKREASKYSGLFVDVEAAFAHHPNYQNYDGHPTDLGQRIVARLLWQAFSRWMGK